MYQFDTVSPQLYSFKRVDGYDNNDSVCTQL